MPKRAATKKAEQRVAVVCLLVGAVMISFSGVWVTLSQVPPSVSAFYRALLGGLFLLLAAIWRLEIRWLSRRQNALILLCGGFFALDLIFYHTSITLVGPGLGTILPNFQVFLMALAGALFFHETLRAIYWLSIPLAIFGLMLVVGVGWQVLDEMSQTGIIAGLAASLCYAAFLLTLRKLQSDERATSFFNVLLMVSFTTAGFLAIHIMATGESFRLPTTTAVWSLTALGLFSQCIGWMLIAAALPVVRVSLSGLVLLLQPALSFVWDVIFFNRPTDGMNWVGVGIVLAAIYMGSIGVRRNR